MRRLLAALVSSVILLAAIASFWIPSASAAPLGLDASASNVCGLCATLSVNLPVTQNDIVVIQMGLNPLGGLCNKTCNVVSVNSPGLTIQNRFTEQWVFSSNDNIWMWEYYAVAPSTGTAGITAVMSIGSAWSIIAYSVSGVNTASPWDPNPSLPAQDFNDCNPTSHCTVPMSTSNANDFIILGLGTQGQPRVAQPSGYTMIASNTNPYMSNSAAFLIVSQTLLNYAAPDWVPNPPQSAQWFADALQSACNGSNCPPPPPSTSTVTTTVTTTSCTSTTTITRTPTLGSVVTMTVTSTETVLTVCTVVTVCYTCPINGTGVTLAQLIEIGVAAAFVAIIVARARFHGG